MFRPNLLLRSRAFPIYRAYCQPGKNYVINVKNAEKEIVSEREISKKCNGKIQPEVPTPVVAIPTQWERLIAIAKHILTKQRQHTMNIIQALKIREKIIALNEAMKEKLRDKVIVIKQQLTLEELKQFPGKAMANWQIFKASKTYESLINMPPEIYKYSLILVARTRHYFVLFMQSKYKDQLVDIGMWILVNGKKTGEKLTKFIYEAYFEKPQPLAIKRKSKH